MQIRELITVLESWAPEKYAEHYDNVGLITGQMDQHIRGVLICLDSTEEIIDEAIRKGFNLVIAHHPILFKGLKKLNGTNYVERAIIKAIKNDVAIYAMHTNLDNIQTGVNHQIANQLGLRHPVILEPKQELNDLSIGSGMVGILTPPMAEKDFIQWVKDRMHLPLVKHSGSINKPITKVAVCGGSGSFLIHAAINAGADAFITADLKYHEYFDADRSILLMDIGHFESERFTIELIDHFIRARFPELEMAQTTLNTNPVQYFV